jgi:transcriptional regulator with XRE-family HTH domain
MIMKRSQQKRMTLKSKIIRYMRVSKGISQARAALAAGCSDQAIGHYETGRMDISEERLSKLIKFYGYSQNGFEMFLKGTPLPVLNLKGECILLLDHIDDTKLKAVYAVLTSFVS